MRTLVLLTVALALLAPLAAAQTTTDPTVTDPNAGAGTDTGTDTTTDTGTTTDTTTDTGTTGDTTTTNNDNDVFVNPPGDGGSDIDTVNAAPFGMAWWAWLLLALIVVGVIAAIAVAMGSRADRSTTVIDREYRGPPPP